MGTTDISLSLSLGSNDPFHKNKLQQCVSDYRFGKLNPKNTIIDAGLSNELLEPKTSFHHIRDYNHKPHPIILISSLFKLISRKNLFLFPLNGCWWFT